MVASPEDAKNCFSNSCVVYFIRIEWLDCTK